MTEILGSFVGLLNIRIYTNRRSEMTKTSFICIVLSITAAATLFVTASAWASEGTHAYPECVTKKTSDVDQAEARRIWLTGQEAYNESRYEDAIKAWEAALLHDCTATLMLQHLSRAYEGAGNLPQAVIALQTFVERDQPKSNEGKELLEQSRTRLVTLKLKSQQQKPTVAQTQSVPTVVSLPQPQQEQPIASRTDETVPTASTVTASANGSVNAATSTKKSSWLPTALIVTGGAATLVGGGLFTYGYIQQKDAASKCASYLCNDHALTEQGNAGKSNAYIGSIIAISGGVVLGTGIVWAILDHKKSNQDDHPQAAKVSAWVSPQSSGVQLSGSF